MATFATNIRLALTTTETRTDGDLAPGTTLIHSGYDVTANLTAATTPDETKAAYDQVAMSGGTGTIDMTALALQDASVTITGLKPRGVLFTALAANAGNLTIAKGASNGYDGLGSAFSITLEPGMSVAVYFSTQGNAVSGTNKTLDLSGTGTDGLTYGIIAGT